jgi:large subunit ribosomal protein L14
MIQQQTVLTVADNSGAKTVRCIKILGGFKKKIGKLGDIIIVSIQKLRNKSKQKSKVKKKEVCKALIIRTKATFSRITGLTLAFNDNAVVLINKHENPIGTRIIGPISNTLKRKTLQKFISIASGLI